MPKRHGVFYLCVLTLLIMIPPGELYGLFLKHPLISTDSRSIIPGSLFFALKGEHFDGNQFALEALHNGAEYAVTDNPDIPAHERIVFVNNVLDSLQKIATVHRKQITAQVIAITGSNGKTTTKELIGRVLGSTYNTTITQGNLNNHIGVPLSILTIKKDTSFAIIEMGANHPGEIEALCRIARPHYGIITNIGKAHLEGFGSIEGVIKAKSELYRFLKNHQGIAFYNIDNDLLTNLSAGTERISYGLNLPAFYQGTIINTEPFLTLKWSTSTQTGIINTSLLGEYNGENIMAAIAVGLHFNVDPDKIENAIASYIPANNRSQIIQTKLNRVISDAYNANPSSMSAAISHFSQMKTSSKMLILGDMMELGDFSFDEHRKILSQIRQSNIEWVVLVGEMFCKVANGGKETCFKDTKDAEAWLKNQSVENMTILLKGSRKMQLENLRKYL